MLLHILVGDSAQIGRERIHDAAGERGRFLCALCRRSHHDLGSREVARGNPLVDLVATDLPPAADYSSRRIIEPRPGATNLDLLPPREPETAVDEGILQNHRHILELLVDQRRTREAEGHAHHFAGLAIDVDGTYGPWLAVIPGAHQHLVDIEYARAQTDLKRIPNGEVIGLESGRRQRVRHVLNFITFANANDVSKVVLDDPEVVAVIVDVGGKKKRIANAHYALLAQVGSTPVDFQSQLIGLHDLWRLGESFSKLCEESDVTVRRRLVVDETGVGQLLRATVRGALDERAGARVVPRLLRTKLARRDEHQENPESRPMSQNHGENSDSGSSLMLGGKLVAG